MIPVLRPRDGIDMEFYMDLQFLLTHGRMVLLGRYLAEMGHGTWLGGISM